MNPASPTVQIPNNYGVLLMPGMFPGGLKEISPIIKAYNIQHHQIIDGSYNTSEYYRDNTFDLEIYVKHMNKCIAEVRNYCDKIISISISYGGLISSILHNDLSLDGNLYISPIYTNRGIHPKYQKRFGHSLLGDEITCIPTWIKFFEMHGYNEAFFYHIAEFLKLRLQLIMNFDLDTFQKKPLHFDVPTVIYFAEKEGDFLERGDKDTSQNDIDKLFEDIISLLNNEMDKKLRSAHCGIHIHKNINFAPLKSITGNYSILTSISHPSLFLGHCEFQKHLQPYTESLKYLIDAIENKTNINQDNQYSLCRVLWEYIFQMIHPNASMSDRESMLQYSSRLIRLDQKDQISREDIIQSFQAYWDGICFAKKRIYQEVINKALEQNKNEFSPLFRALVSIINGT